ncbi:hypothetical protein BpHYR1_001535 [Brachionus plicatilis]|uniref:Uncharacterized protein n=1 Tax=Brachionus plicatilis TaxID=10195 RepID=A0A3M7Q102_BRAPC|nr:hypothetical protein BpHYR1_001535 [Brachionus plicatilis]
MNENSSVDNSPVVTRMAEGKFAGTTSIRNYLMAHDIRIESNKWDVERKVEFISTDNASNVCKAISYFNSTIIHMRCMGHILNLIVKKLINYKHDVSYSITATQQASQDSFVDFDEEDDENETDVAGYSDLIIPFTFSLNEMNSIKKFHLILTDSDTTELNDIVEILFGFDDATKRLSSEKNDTLSMILPLFMAIKTDIQISEDFSEFKSNLASSFLKSTNF